MRRQGLGRHCWGWGTSKHTSVSISLICRLHPQVSSRPSPKATARCAGHAGDATYLVYCGRHDCGIALVLPGRVVCLRGEESDRDDTRGGLALLLLGEFESQSGNFDGGAKFKAEGWPQRGDDQCPHRLDVTVCPHRPAAKVSDSDTGFNAGGNFSPSRFETSQHTVFTARVRP